MNTTFQIIAWMPGPWELAVIGILGLLVFGKRLPEVGKSLGKSIVEFKKGLRGIEDEIDRSTDPTQPDMLPPPSRGNSASSSKTGGSASSGSQPHAESDSYANTTNP